IPSPARDGDAQENQHGDHVFSSAYSAGTFNAALSQITCLDPVNACKIADAPSELPRAPYTEYGWPSFGAPHCPAQPFAPVLWVTVLGRDGFWPLAVLDGGVKEGNVASSPRP